MKVPPSSTPTYHVTLAHQSEFYWLGGGGGGGTVRNSYEQEYEPKGPNLAGKII